MQSLQCYQTPLWLLPTLLSDENAKLQWELSSGDLAIGSGLNNLFNLEKHSTV